MTFTLHPISKYSLNFNVCLFFYQCIAEGLYEVLVNLQDGFDPYQLIRTGGDQEDTDGGVHKGSTHKQYFK